MLVQFLVCLRINFFKTYICVHLVSLQGLYDQATNCENNHHENKFFVEIDWSVYVEICSYGVCLGLY